MTRIFHRQAEKIEAVRFDGDNTDEIFRFARPSSCHVTLDQPPKVRVLSIDGGYDIAPGDHLVKHRGGRLEHLTDEAFRDRYDEGR